MQLADILCKSESKDLTMSKEDIKKFFFEFIEATAPSSQRGDFIKEVENAFFKDNWEELLDTLIQLHNCIPSNSQIDDWEQWKRQFWRNFVLEVRPSHGLTHALLALLMLEKSLRSGEGLENSEKWQEKCQQYVDPFAALLLAADCIEVHLTKLATSTIDSYNRRVKSCLRNLRDAAEKLDEVSKGCGIAQTTSGAIGIGSGLTLLGGLALAPFTGGASVVFTAVGIGAGVVSGVTSLTTALVKLGLDKDAISDGNSKTDEVTGDTFILLELLLFFQDTVNKANDYINSASAHKLRKAIMDNDEKEFVLQMSVAATKWFADVGKGVYKTVSSVKSAARLLSLIRTLTPSIAREVGRDIAEFYAIPGIVFKIPGLSIPAAAMVGRVLTVAGSAVAIGFGIWDVVDGIDKIENKSEIGKKFRDHANGLEKISNEIISGYSEISKMLNYSRLH